LQQSYLHIIKLYYILLPAPTLRRLHFPLKCCRIAAQSYFEPLCTLRQTSAYLHYLILFSVSSEDLYLCGKSAAEITLKITHKICKIKGEENLYQSPSGNNL